MLNDMQKRQCLRMLSDGIPTEAVYNDFVKLYSGMTLASFRRMVRKWRKKQHLDHRMLEAANLDYRFTPHASTVQVNARGEVVQAWIRQDTENMWEELLDAVKTNTPPRVVEPAREAGEGMLEIPLFDMHFGIADIDYYRNTLAEILTIVNGKRWEKVVIPVGQDLFHNDSISKGVTTKGTLIEKVNLKQAVLDAKEFYTILIDEAIKNAAQVQVLYSPGNHDRTVGWMFVEILKAMYGDIVDDSVKERKCVWWNGCFIGLTHGDKSSDNIAGLRGKFTHEYAALYAAAKVREIHAGHLHRESDSRDEYGCQVRRLCTGGKTDEWTDEQGYMSQKRFMMFEWAPGRLKAIHYV